MMKTVLKHAAEFRRAIQRREYEMTPAGIVFPKQQARFSGAYHHSVNGGEVTIDHNLVPDAGILSILNVYFGGTSKISAFYLALFSGAVNPTPELTAANFASTMTEITSNTEGYSETTRPQFVAGSAASGVIGNLASKAQFTINCTTSITVNGAAMLSSNTKGGTSGVLPSCSRFTNARTLYDGDNFELGYTVTLTG